MIADLTWLTGVIGEEAVRVLVRGWGGLTLRVPKTAGGADWLAAIGETAATALIGAAGGDDVYVPKCDGAERARRDAEIIAAYTAGARVPALARQYGLSERWVWAILGRSVADAGQGMLF